MLYLYARLAHIRVLRVCHKANIVVFQNGDFRSDLMDVLTRFSLFTKLIGRYNGLFETSNVIENFFLRKMIIDGRLIYDKLLTVYANAQQPFSLSVLELIGNTIKILFFDAIFFFSFCDK